MMSNKTPTKALIFIFAIAIGAAVITAYSALIMDWAQVNWKLALLFLSLTILSESFPVNLPHGGKLSVSYATIIASIILFQPFTVILIASIYDLALMVKKDNRIKNFFNATQLAVITGSASLFYNYFAPPVIELTFNHLMVFFATIVILFFFNALFVTLIISLANMINPYTVWQGNIKWATLTNLSTSLIGVTIALVYDNIGIWGLIIFIIPLVIARQANQSYINMRQTYLDTMASLSMAIDAKDPYTRGHSSRVADYVALLARELKWKEKQIEFIHYVATIHDIGKIAVPETILNKESLLTAEEYDIMKQHSSAGAKMIENLKLFLGSSNIIKHHHERYDGTGYPDGLKGDDIPEGSRLLFVADAFDAMTSTRPYRKAMNQDEAIKELKDFAGTQFDPKMVDAFIRVISKCNLKTDSNTLPSSSVTK